MKVTVCPADEGGCGSYRMIWPAQALQAEGENIEIVYGKNIWAGEDSAGKVGAWIGPPPEYCGDGLYRVTEDSRDLDCDVLVIQRPLDRARAEAIPLVQSLGIAVVVEVDDDFSRIDPRNVAYRNADPETNPAHNWQHLKTACANADLVTVSTPALARRFAPHGRVAVLNNCIPARYLHAERLPREGVAVGWSGSVDTHPGDLNATGGGVARAVQGFHVIGTGVGVQDALGLAKPPSATNWVMLNDYPKYLAQLDVGIVPLRASAFNRAKSWLKGLEMAACGVAFVASDTPEYRRLARLGAGRLASRSQDWEREVRQLVKDRVFREECQARGRQVAAKLTIEGNAWKWATAWSEARAMRLAA